MAAYDDLTARLDELETNLAFTSLAVSLRPQLNGVLRWDGAPETVALSRKFMDTKARVENIYGALLIQSVATFERFLRALIDDTATKTADISKNYAEVKEHVRNRHAVLTGKLLSSLEAPLDYQAVDVKQLAENLASCVSGRSLGRLGESSLPSLIRARWCRSIGGKVVGISYRRVSNLLYCCLRCLHLRTSQILPTDQASQPHLTAAQEAEEQEQHGLFAGE